MQDENSFTKARPFSIPQPGPAVTNAERTVNVDPFGEAGRNMKALRR